MSEFGYLPDSANIEQSFGNNKGIFTPKDIYDLTRSDKYTNYGQLELIETQTVSSSTAYVDFTNLKTNFYNVHLMTVNNFKTSGANSHMGFRLIESGVVESSAVYQYARQLGQADGTFSEVRSTGQDEGIVTSAIGDNTNNRGHCYIYFYNLGDSTKYSFLTQHSVGMNDSNVFATDFGSNVLPQASQVDGIRMIPNANNILEADISLYGIKEYS